MSRANGNKLMIAGALSPLQSGPARNLFSSKALRYPTGFNLSTPDAHVLEPKTC